VILSIHAISQHVEAAPTANECGQKTRRVTDIAPGWGRTLLDTSLKQIRCKPAQNEKRARGRRRTLHLHHKPRSNGAWHREHASGRCRTLYLGSFDRTLAGWDTNTQQRVITFDFPDKV